MSDNSGIPPEEQPTGQTLYEQWELLRNIVDSVPAALSAVDRQLCYRFNNKIYEEWFGHPLSEILGKPFPEVVGDETYRLVQHHVETAMSGQTAIFDVLVPLKDAGDRHLEARYTPDFGPQGDVRGFFVFAYDITARKQLEQELRDSEQRIRREASRAKALMRVAARLNAQLNLEEVLCAVCEETARALEAPAVVVLLHEPQQAVLELADTYGLPPQFRKRYRPTPVALYERYAHQQGPFFVVPDTQAEPRLINAKLYTEFDVRTIAITSLIRDRQLIGTLSAYYLGSPHPFSSDQLDLLQGLADQAAQAIDNARLGEQASQLAVMQERARLARELHDSVTQSLYSLTLLAEGRRRLIRSGQANNVVETLSEMGEIAQQALKEMRLLVYELRPPMLEEEGLLGALHQRLAAVEKRAGVEVRLLAEDIVEVPPPIEEGLFKIAQEALNNSLKHAAATTITIRLRMDRQRLVLEVTDDGRGFDMQPETDHQGGVGLTTMRERAERLGGSLEVHSAPGQGTTVLVRVDTKGASNE
jgi:PAS domain S-box-containing protein